jgi:hypothetical protein
MRSSVLHLELLITKVRNKKWDERVCLYGEEITAPGVFAAIEYTFSFSMQLTETFVSDKWTSMFASNPRINIGLYILNKDIRIV